MIESIVLGGGCFWCNEATLGRLKGVMRVEPGYAGGQQLNPTYAQVCTGQTGHAEVVRVTFDSSALTLAQLLRVFMVAHDPTTLNRQGADQGTQYRSIILTNSDTQAAVARQVLADLTAERVYEEPIVTEVEILRAFYPAEPEHVDYYRHHPEAAYCQAVIAPKVAHVRAEFKDLWRD